MDCPEKKTKRIAEWNAGFTIIELLIASFIATTVLLSVYTVFRQAIEVESKARISWNSRAAAESIVTHLAEILENSVNLPEIPTLVGKPGMMKCLTGGKGHIGGLFDQGGIKREYFTWQSGTIKKQTLKYAGTKNITPYVDLEELSEEQLWTRVPSRIIGKNIDTISIHYMKVNDPIAQWKDHWHGAVGNVAVWIRIRSHDQVSERMVVPRVNTTLTP